MKITDVKTEKLSIELAEPFHVAFGTITHGDNWRVKVMTDEGIYGNGSAKCAFDIALYVIFI